jgi:hypothetical protein
MLLSLPGWFSPGEVIMSLGWLHSQPGRLRDEKELLSLPEIKLRLLGYPACNIASVTAELLYVG